MHIHQQLLRAGLAAGPLPFEPTLLLLFGSRELLSSSGIFEALRQKYPSACITGCSTSGEILGEQVTDDSIALTAIHFEKSRLRWTEVDLDDLAGDSEAAGRTLAAALPAEGLRHILVFSEGLRVNGTALVQGMDAVLPRGVTVTGGLAGDGTAFGETVVISPTSGPESALIVAVGLYGDALRIGYGSKGGWNTFGVDRLVTRSTNNILYEIDGQPALELYRSFLGDKAAELPASGLLFPLSMRASENEPPVVRTILAIDDREQSLTFAGDIPQGSYVRLMKSNVDRLIDGAAGAAEFAAQQSGSSTELALLVSCVGRKLVLKQLVEEEVEVVSAMLGKPAITGFYSYGELAPSAESANCALHNQTMTITTLSE